MDRQLLTTVVQGTKHNLEHSISHLNLCQGSWCISIHSVWANVASLQTFSSEIQISCNLSFSRKNAREIIKTPLVVFFVDKTGGGNYAHCHYSPKRIPLTAQSDKLVFFIGSADPIPESAILGIHFSLERFL